MYLKRNGSLSSPLPLSSIDLRPPRKYSFAESLRFRITSSTSRCVVTSLFPSLPFPFHCPSLHGHCSWSRFMLIMRVGGGAKTPAPTHDVYRVLTECLLSFPRNYWGLVHRKLTAMPQVWVSSTVSRYSTICHIRWQDITSGTSWYLTRLFRKVSAE